MGTTLFVWSNDWMHLFPPLNIPTNTFSFKPILFHRQQPKDLLSWIQNYIHIPKNTFFIQTNLVFTQTFSHLFSHSTTEASWLSGTVRDVQARGRQFDPRLRWICFDIVLLGKALCWRMHSLDAGVSGYLVGQWRLVSLNSSVRWKNGSRAVCSPGSWDGLWTSRSYDQGVIVWSWASGASH